MIELLVFHILACVVPSENNFNDILAIEVGDRRDNLIRLAVGLYAMRGGLIFVGGPDSPSPRNIKIPFLNALNTFFEHNSVLEIDMFTDDHLIRAISLEAGPLYIRKMRMTRFNYELGTLKSLPLVLLCWTTLTVICH